MEDYTTKEYCSIILISLNVGWAYLITYHFELNKLLTVVQQCNAHSLAHHPTERKQSTPLTPQAIERNSFQSRRQTGSLADRA